MTASSERTPAPGGAAEIRIPAVAAGLPPAPREVAHDTRIHPGYASGGPLVRGGRALSWEQTPGFDPKTRVSGDEKAVRRRERRRARRAKGRNGKAG